MCQGLRGIVRDLALKLGCKEEATKRRQQVRREVNLGWDDTVEWRVGARGR